MLELLLAHLSADHNTRQWDAYGYAPIHVRLATCNMQHATCNMQHISSDYRACLQWALASNSTRCLTVLYWHSPCELGAVTRDGDSLWTLTIRQDNIQVRDSVSWLGLALLTTYL
jgi:hypothetical protein